MKSTPIWMSTTARRRSKSRPTRRDVPSQTYQPSETPPRPIKDSHTKSSIRISAVSPTRCRAYQAQLPQDGPLNPSKSAERIGSSILQFQPSANLSTGRSPQPSVRAAASDFHLSAITYEGQAIRKRTARSRPPHPLVYEVRYGQYDGSGQDQAQPQPQPRWQRAKLAAQRRPRHPQSGAPAAVAAAATRATHRNATAIRRSVPTAGILCRSTPPALKGYAQTQNSRPPGRSLQQPYYGQSHAAQNPSPYGRQLPGRRLCTEPGLSPGTGAYGPPRTTGRRPPGYGRTARPVRHRMSLPPPPASGIGGGPIYSPSGPATASPRSPRADGNEICSAIQRPRCFPRPPACRFATCRLQIDPEETQTGRLMFGVGVNSDAGLVGNVTIDEQNFDWGNVPSSWEDVMEGRAGAVRASASAWNWCPAPRSSAT